VKIDQDRQQLNRWPAIRARSGESLEQHFEMLQELSSEQGRFESPSAFHGSVWHGRLDTDAVREAIRENEPANHADANTLEVMEMAVDLRTPVWDS